MEISDGVEGTVNATALIIADSLSPKGVRLTTIEVTLPRYVHAELMTHRVFSRNASSSRAVPVKRMLKSVNKHFIYPMVWGLNQAGMQAKDAQLTGWKKHAAKFTWWLMAKQTILGVRVLSALGLHKQWANRPLEWFTPIKVLITATEWSNFFELRMHKDAQPEIRNLAEVMYEAMKKSKPKFVDYGQWHLPYVTQQELETNTAKDLQVMSTARCARVSYLNHNLDAPTYDQDLGLYIRLVGSEPKHASPLEHVATPTASGFSRNFDGWISHRATSEGEAYVNQ